VEVFFENAIRKPAIPDEDRFQRYEARAIGSGCLRAGTDPLTPVEQGAIPHKALDAWMRRNGVEVGARDRAGDESPVDNGTEIVLEIA